MAATTVYTQDRTLPTDITGLACLGSFCTPSADDVLDVVERGSAVVGTAADTVGTVAAMVPGGQGVAAGAFSVGRAADAVGAGATCLRTFKGSRDGGDCLEAVAFVAVPDSIEKVIAPGQTIYRHGRRTQVWDRGGNLARGGLSMFNNSLQWALGNDIGYDLDGVPSSSRGQDYCEVPPAFVGR